MKRQSETPPKVMAKNKLFAKIIEKTRYYSNIRERWETFINIISMWMARRKLPIKIAETTCYYESRFRRQREQPINFIPVSTQNILDMKEILDKAGVKFWLSFGTFLGAYRDQALIPYDHDTDIAIYAEDLPKLGQCVDEFIKKGFTFRVAPDPAATYKVSLYRGGEVTGFGVFQLKENKRVWKSIEYDVSAFETFNEIQFLGQKWRIFSEPERWLRYTYGEDWRTPIKGKGGGRGRAWGEKFESDRAIE